MKKLILLFAVIGFAALASITKTNRATNIAVIQPDKYKACIDACNKCMASCRETEKICKKEKNPKMAGMEKICRECITACEKAVKAMKENKNVKAECGSCAKICDKCAAECDKFNMAESKKCAEECRGCAKLCNEMS